MEVVDVTIETTLEETELGTDIQVTVGLPSDILVTQCLSVGMEKIKNIVFPLLFEVLSEDGQTVRGIYERNDVAIRKLEGMEENKGWFVLPNVTVPDSTETEIIENGIKYSVDFENGQILSGPDIISRGFVYVRESEELMSEARNIVVSELEDALMTGNSDRNAIKTKIKDALSGFIYKKTKRSPMILPILQEL